MPAPYETFISVMSLHSIRYCERLHYLEEVERIRIADDAVFAGRTLHEELKKTEEESGDWFCEELASQNLGLIGKVDALRRRDGRIIPYEHKRGRVFRENNKPGAWISDKVQIAAYAMLLEERFGEPIPEGRVRYHADNITVKIPIDEPLRENVRQSIIRAGELAKSIHRPPVAKNEKLCIKCALAPVCLPEEERLAADDSWEPVRLFPPDRQGKVIHVTDYDVRIGRSGDALKITGKSTGDMVLPVIEISSVVIHSYAQITTQALHLLSKHEIPVHYLSGGGYYVAGIVPGPLTIQRRLRQYEALSDNEFCLKMTKKLAMAKIEGQLRYLLRATTSIDREQSGVSESIRILKESLRSISSSDNADSVRGHEGMAGRAYFAGLPAVLRSELPDELRYSKRTRRPPKDRFSALQSFGYTLLYQAVMQAVLSVGLEPALGFFHTPRSTGHPLVLDLMELFRTTLWDIPMIGSLNRLQWNPSADFVCTKDKVWLSEEGKKKAICLFEKRLEENWKHPVINYSLSYARHIELETRLLEKEWDGEPGLFARMRLR
ncbi:MAG: type I-MYXAN CRISPR-associated endonuclease Cas1 [Firmicutes bacterium]|nr:type I-MYXAN CRISPR-associated endonuclease Cas1 [Bacillota bacterium]